MLLLHESPALITSSKFANTVKPVLSGHPRDPRYCPLNRGVRLINTGWFYRKYGRKKLEFAETDVCLINAGCPLNTGFTVFAFYMMCLNMLVKFFVKDENFK